MAKGSTVGQYPAGIGREGGKSERPEGPRYAGESASVSDEDLNQIRAAFRERLDAAAGSIGEDFSELRSEMRRRFDLVDRRFEALERRQDRMDTHIGAVLLETSGVSKSLAAGERLDTAISATQSAQQKAIDDLSARLRAVERRLEVQ